MLKVFEVRTNKKDNSISNFELIFNSDCSTPFKSGYQIKKNKNGKYSFPLFFKALLLNKNKIGVDFLFGKHIQFDTEITKHRYLLKFNDKQNNEHLTSGYATSNGLYSELSAGFLEIDDKGVYSELPSGLAINLTIDKNLYKIFTKKNFYVEFSLCPLNESKNTHPLDNQYIIFQNNKDYKICCLKKSKDKYLNKILPRKDIIYINGNTSLGAKNLKELYSLLKKNISSTINESMIIKYSGVNIWGENTRESSVLYIIDDDKKADIKEIIRDSQYNSFTNIYSKTHNNIIDNKNGIMNFRSVGLKSIFKNEGYGNSLESGIGGWKYFYKTLSDLPSIRGKIEKPIPPLGKGVFNSAIGLHDYDSKYDASKREMLKKYSNQNNINSIYGENLNFDIEIDSSTTFFQPNLSSDEEIFYIFHKDSSSNNYLSESLYHHTVKFLLNNNLLSNVIDDDPLYANFKNLNLSNKEILFYNTDGDNIISTTKGNNILYNLIKYAKSSESSNRTKYSDYYNTHIKITSSILTLKYHNGITSSKDTIDMKSYIIEPLIEHDKSLTNSIFYVNNPYNSINNLNSISSILKNEQEVNKIMANLSSLLMIKNYNKFSIDFLILKKEEDKNTRIAALNHLTVGERNKLLFYLREGSDDKYNVYATSISDDMIKSNNYSKFLDEKFEILIASNIELSVGKILSSLESFLQNSNSFDDYTLSNEINIYSTNSDIVTQLKKQSTKDNDSIVSENGFYIRNIIELSKTKNNYIDKIVPLKSLNTFSLNTIPSNTLEKLSAGFSINKDKTTGLLLSKLNQNNINYIETHSNIKPSFNLDINKIFGDKNVSMNLEDMNIYMQNYTFEILLNGYSNNFNVLISNGTPKIDTDETNKFFDVKFNKKNKTFVITYLDEVSKNIIKENSYNKISVVVRYNSAKIYYEEVYFNKMQKDVIVQQLKLSLLNTIDNKVDRNNCFFNVFLETKSSNNQYIPTDITSTKNDYYNLKMIDKNNNEYILKKKINTVNRILSLNKLTFIESVFKLKKLENSLETKKTESLLFGSWKIVLERVVPGSSKNIVFSTINTEPAINDNDIKTRIYYENNGKKEFGNLPELLAGKLVITPTNNYSSFDEIQPFIKDIDVIYNGKSITYKDIKGGCDYNKSVYQNRIFKYGSENKSIAFGIFPKSSDPSYNANPSNLTFFNDGTNKNVNFKIKITLHGGKIISNYCENNIGGTLTLKTPIVNIDSQYNNKMRIDKNNPNLFISYDNNISFEINEIDNMSEYYRVSQLSNEIVSDMPITSNRIYHYSIDKENIKYITLNENNLVAPVKYSNKVAFVDDSGETKYRQSNQAKIDYCIRKRPSTAVLKCQNNFGDAITVNKNCNVIESIGKFKIEFDTNNNIYYSDLIFKLKSIFIDNATGKEIQTTKVCIMKDGTTRNIKFIAGIELSDKTQIKEKIKSNSEIILDYFSVPVSIMFDGAGNKILSSDIASITGEKENFLTIRNILTEYIKSNEGLIKSKECKVIIKSNTYDEILTDENLIYLKNIRKLTDEDILNIEKNSISESSYTYLDVNIQGSDTLTFTPSLGLFRNADPKVVNKETINTYYTYSDEISLDLTSGNAKKFQYKLEGSTAFIDLPMDEIIEEGISIFSSKLKLSLFGSKELSLQVRKISLTDYTENPILFKIVKINKNNIIPKISYSKVQDQVTNIQKYNKKSVVFELTQNTNISYYKYRFVDKMGEVLQDYITQNSIAENIYLSCEISEENTVYTLEILAYDLSNRLIKNFKYPVLLVSSSILPTNLTCENQSSIVDNKYVINDNSINLTWDNQTHLNISKYKIVVNNSYEFNVKQKIANRNSFELTHLGGDEITAGNYVFEIIPINILGNESPQSKHITIKFARIPKYIYCNIETFKHNYTNKVNCKVYNYDTGNTYKFYYTVNYIDETGSKKSIAFTSNRTTLEFINGNGTIDNEILDNSKVTIKIYPMNKNEYYSENLYAEHSFYLKKNAVVIANDNINFLSLTKDTRPMFLIKKPDTVYTVEAKLNNETSNYKEVKNNIFICPQSLTDGTYSFNFKYTDYAGNISEISRTIEINLYEDNGEAYKHSLVDEVIANTSTASYSFEPFFNLDFYNFGHKKLLFSSNTIGFETFILTNSNNSKIKIPDALDSGIYSYKVYSYNEDTKLYDNLIKEALIHFIKEAVESPKITNQSYDETENNVAYINSNSINLTFEVKETLKYVEKLKCDIKKKNNSGNYELIKTIDIDKTDINKILPISPIDGANTFYEVDLYNVGTNKQNSGKDIFYFNILRKKPKPLVFPLSPDINLKYDSKKTGAFNFYFEDNNDIIQKLVKVKFNLNDSSVTGIKTLTDLYDNTTGYYKYSVYDAKAGKFRLTTIAYDKANNESIIDINEAELLSKNLNNKQYLYFDKIIDTIKPVVLNDNAIHISKNIDGSYNKFNVYFDLPNGELCYLKFKLLTGENNILLSEGNTFPYHSDLKNIPMESSFLKGIDKKYDVKVNKNIKDMGEDFENIHLTFSNVPTGIHKLELNIIDIAGNISDTYIKEIEILDTTQKKPYFISPTSSFTNNSNIIFEWGVDLDNIEKWEYQFINITKGEAFSNINSDWSKTFENGYRYKVPTSKSYDGQYAIKIRGVSKDIDKNGKKFRTAENIKYIIIDREIPGGLRFLNETFTQDQTFLKWEWEYLKDKDGNYPAGAYVTFNANTDINQWEKITTANYTSEQVRDDGAYTLYAKTFDQAGNLSNEVFTNTIYLDTEPPQNVELDLQNTIVTNEIPTIKWKNNLNIIKYFWLLIKTSDFDNFKKEYYELGLSNIKSEYDYIWNKNFNKTLADQIPNKIKNFVSKYKLKKNNSVTTNSLYLNYSENIKHGINADGKYTFLVVGQEESTLYTKEFSSINIKYDSTLPNKESMKFLKPVFTSLETKRPLIEINTSKDIFKAIINIKMNNSGESILSSTIETYRENKENKIFSYTPSFNIPYGEYFIEAKLYDDANNYITISKFIVIETQEDNTFEDVSSFYIPDINAIAKIKKVRYSDSYVIQSINISQNSSIFYREKLNSIKQKKFSMLKLDETRLELSNKEYEFKVVGYVLEDIKI